MPRNTGWGQIDKRLKDLEDIDQGEKLMEKQESGENYSSRVHTKPTTVKVFSDGSVREWSEEKQEWVRR